MRAQRRTPATSHVQWTFLAHIKPKCGLFSKSVLQEKVYRSKIGDVDELKTRLIDEWAQFGQSIVDAAISHHSDVV